MGSYHDWDKEALIERIGELEGRLAEAAGHLKQDWAFFAFDTGPGGEDAVRVEKFLTAIGHPRPSDSAGVAHDTEQNYSADLSDASPSNI